jgi:GTP-binding protein TypA/BipA
MQDIRNIAIIAHVDHGKTTLVDKMMLAGHLFRNDQTNGELVLDNNDLERERGITILSKNVSINYKGTKINIIDTPGHADFGGEVERVLNMADGCILLVDAFEGPMPQTRFVLQKALQIGLKPVVVVNKVDKPNCRPEEVYEMVFDLMFSLNATEDQLDFPVIYGSAKNNWMSTDWKTPTENLVPLLDAIIEHIPAPKQLEVRISSTVPAAAFTLPIPHFIRIMVLFLMLPSVYWKGPSVYSFLFSSSCATCFCSELMAVIIPIFIIQLYLWLQMYAFYQSISYLCNVNKQIYL